MADPYRSSSDPEPLLAASRVEDVFAATEEVRAAEFDDVSADLLAGVLAAERDNPEDRAAAFRAVGRVIEDHLAHGAGGRGGRNEEDRR